MRRLLLSLILLGLAQGALPAEEKKLPSIAAKVNGFKRLPGYFGLYLDEEKGRLWLKIEEWEKELLYVNSLARGLGSNDIGLDRGQLGRSRIVYFRRVGPKVLLVQPNYAYRALTTNPAEKKAVEESFAQSILWGFQVGAVDGNAALVDATDFFLRDAHRVAEVLRQKKEGTWSLDDSRSVLYLPRTRNFPDNTEVEATLTFTGKPNGKYVPTVAPTPEAITVHQHHSLIRLPRPGYRPRRFHPRCGFFWTELRDYAAPLGKPLDVRYIRRHRLEKKQPDEPKSEAVKPIIYYLDSGAPEPVRTALLEGARWWNEAFEAIGFRNAFQVRMLPEDVDPMDVRYNVIQWVHRSTRGWSYGSSVMDPRTGEILKGHVTLGSLRVRQDMRIAEGLLSPFEKGIEVSKAAMDMALARLRQLSAHEVGHTIGLAHNFAASLKGNGSVMDYPHPFLTGFGKPDLSKAYGKGIGPWDKAAIAYGYSEVPKGVEEGKVLDAILARALKEGLLFISDRDARPAGGAHPKAHLWDNGKDPTTELLRLLQVRERALFRFSEKAIPVGAPLALLEEKIVPVYLLHRYQVEAVSKVLGGVEYQYSVRGDLRPGVAVVPKSVQMRALLALRKTLEPKVLALPEKVLRLIPPRSQGLKENRELFPRKTGPILDPFTVAEAAADHTVQLILHPARCNRLVEQSARDSQQPGLGRVIETLLENSWKSGLNDYHEAIQRVVDHVILYRLMALAVDDQASEGVKAMVALKLRDLKKTLSGVVDHGNTREKLKAHALLALKRLERFEKEPGRISVPKPLSLPPGSPIGCGCP